MPDNIDSRSFPLTYPERDDSVINPLSFSSWLVLVGITDELFRRYPFSPNSTRFPTTASCGVLETSLKYATSSLSRSAISSFGLNNTKKHQCEPDARRPFYAPVSDSASPEHELSSLEMSFPNLSDVPSLYGIDLWSDVGIYSTRKFPTSCVLKK